MNDDPLTIAEVCFGTEIYMLAWAKEEGLPLLKKIDGYPDWNAMYDIWLERLDKEDKKSGRAPEESHFHSGTPQEMLAWAKEENLPILKNPEGDYLWEITYEIWIRRLERKTEEQ